MTVVINSAWKDYSLSAVDKQKRALSEWLRLFDQVNPKTLDAEDRLNRDLMLRHLQEQLTSLRWKTYEMPINPHSGVHLELVETVSVTPFDNASDYASYLERLHGLPKVVEDWIGVLEQGKKDRLVPFRQLVEEAIPQCTAIGNAKGMSSPFSGPLQHFPDLSGLIHRFSIVKRTDDLPLLRISPNQKAERCHGSRVLPLSVPELSAHV